MALSNLVIFDLIVLGELLDFLRSLALLCHYRYLPNRGVSTSDSFSSHLLSFAEILGEFGLVLIFILLVAALL